MKSWFFRYYSLTLINLVFIIVLAIGQEVDVPVNTQVPIFFKILAFDRNLQTKAKDEINIGIVYQGKFNLSRDIKDSFVSELDNLVDNKIQELPVKYFPIDLDLQNLETAIKNKKINIIYVTPLRAFDIKKITTLSRQYQVCTLTGISEYVEKGIAVGIDVKGDRPEILINLQAAKSENSDFSSQLLKLAHIY